MNENSIELFSYIQTNINPKTINAYRTILEFRNFRHY